MGDFNIHRTKYFKDAVFHQKSKIYDVLSLLNIWLAKKTCPLHEILTRLVITENAFEVDVWQFFQCENAVFEIPNKTHPTVLSHDVLPTVCLSKHWCEIFFDFAVFFLTIPKIQIFHDSELRNFKMQYANGLSVRRTIVHRSVKEN